MIHMQMYTYGCTSSTFNLSIFLIMTDYLKLNISMNRFLLLFFVLISRNKSFLIKNKTLNCDSNIAFYVLFDFL